MEAAAESIQSCCDGSDNETPVIQKEHSILKLNLVAKLGLHNPDRSDITTTVTVTTNITTYYFHHTY